MSATKYGDCSSYLFMARDFGLDYGEVLEMADYLVHNRRPAGNDDRLYISTAFDAVKAQIGEERGDEFIEAMAMQVFRFRELRRGLDVGPPQTEPMGVAWWTPESVKRYIPTYS